MGQLDDGGVALIAALATSFDLPWVQLLERQTQALFFELRGPVPTPAHIVIVTIDDNVLKLGYEYHQAGIDRPYLSLIQNWPWPRQTYALVIDRLLQARARSVSLDLLFTTPSLYGPQDDQALVAVLVRVGKRVVLAAQYTTQANQPGSLDRLLAPLPQFEDLAQIGTINYLTEANGRIHQLGSQFVNEQLRRLPPAQAVAFQQLAGGIPTFAEATLHAAQLSYPTPAGSNLFFYGPASSFDQVSFLDLLDPDTWEKQFQSGAYFRDKIVLIGSTATAHQDFHATPFANSWLFLEKMPGIVINATAIATLLQGRAIAEAIPPAPLRGLAVLLVTAGAAWGLTRPRSLLGRWGMAVGLGSTWLVLGYVILVQGNLILPIAVPATAIVLGGLAQLVVGTAQEQRRKRQLRDTLKHYATSPIVQEIISQQEDLQDLLQVRQAALAGTFLSHRYKIVRVLGSGGFGETYVAADTQRPASPSVWSSN
ncbi:CHASE2 domain-containing protein [Trichothermofontia sp.]